jgi:hypothetical protein
MKTPFRFYRNILRIGMIILILGIFGCATAPTAGRQDDGSHVFILTPEQVAQCEREGGCSTVTLQYERELVRESAKHFCGVEI